MVGAITRDGVGAAPLVKAIPHNTAIVTVHRYRDFIDFICWLSFERRLHVLCDIYHLAVKFLQVSSAILSGNQAELALPNIMRTNSAQPALANRGNKLADRGGLLREFVHRLPLMPPVEISRELEIQGYKGQSRQRAALALMAYRHVRRLKRIHVDGEPRDNLPPKQNILMVGPTGCGKTYLVELLFEQILGVPTIILDATNFTERGYVGDDVSTMLTRLVEKSQGDASFAACGVVCLDEFDKLASSSSNARFAGQGTTKDVSGYGVQRELLTLIEGTDALAPMDYGFSGQGPRLGLSTKDIPFIACGAFSGLEVSRSQIAKKIGFGDRTGNQPEASVMQDVAVFQRYGFMPELIGRFTQILTFPPLDRETLRTILLENVLPRFQNEFRGEGIDLRVTDEALSHIVGQAAARDTGARGLQAELVGIVEQAAFEKFMHQRNVVLTITTEDGILTCVQARDASRERPTSIKSVKSYGGGLSLADDGVDTPVAETGDMVDE